MIVLPQILEHVGGEEGRKRGTKTDIRNSQMQQGEQDADRLLFVPGKDQGQGKFIDAAAKGIRQGTGNLTAP